jgi:transposase
MDQKIRRVHPAAFKARVALEALKEQKTIAELSGMYSIHTTQITKWKKQGLDILVSGFGSGQKRQEKEDSDLMAELYRQIGRLKVEVDFLKKKMGIFER